MLKSLLLRLYAGGLGSRFRDCLGGQHRDIGGRLTGQEHIQQFQIEQLPQLVNFTTKCLLRKVVAKRGQ